MGEVEVDGGKRRLEDGWRIWACSLIGIYLSFWVNVRQEISGKVSEVDDAW
jgi:hypothetical protein